MELSDDLVAIQGILISVIKTTGEFTKIKYKGGNQEKILKIIDEIRKYIINKNYIKEDRFNEVFDKNVEDIVLFLTINTDYKKPLKLEDYDHLINIMPQLSKCVLVNIVFDLDLCKYFCKAIEVLPLTYVVELLEEVLPCLKKSNPVIHLRYATMLLRTTAMKLSSAISEKEEDVFELTKVTKIMLQFLTGIHPVHARNLKAVQIYQHMGYTLLNLFDLLLYCNKESVNLKKFIDNALKATCTVVKNVTLNVFCSWAEINEGDEPLQSIVSGRAYQVVEEYQKYEDAKELVGILGAIARKPKTLYERIQAAEVEMIIKKVYAKDQDQKSWFQALLNTQIFANEDAMSCVSAWAQLCDKSDVTRLIRLSCESKNEEARQLALKCASTLSLDDLISVMTSYFYEHKFNGLVSDIGKVESQLQLIFNKTSGGTNTDEDFIKDMCLLMLQSPETVLKGVYGECVRSKCYVKCYEQFFNAVKEIVNIHNFGTAILWQTILGNLPDAYNVDNYVALLSILAENNYLSINQIINGLVLPLLDQFCLEKGFEQLGLVLQILLGCSFKIPATSQMTKVRWAILNIMNDCRCTFLEMDIVKQQTASYAVDVVKSLCEVHSSYNLEEESETAPTTAQSYDSFTNYYKNYLACKTDSTLLRTLYRDFNTENYEKCLCHVLNFLPRAVTSEWTIIIQEIFFVCGSEKAMELLTDTMVLLCKVVQTQNPSTNTGKQVVVALRYCLQQYGNALQNIQADSVEETEVVIAKNVCRLLRHLPESVKEQEGLSLVNVLTQRALKSLSNDRDFICLLISVNSSAIYRSVTQRMFD